MHPRLASAAAALLLITAGAASAQSTQTSGPSHFTAQLKASSEVPPNTTGGTGQVTAALDGQTKMLTYTVSYSGLTGPPTAAHFHGPAPAGQNAPPVVPVTDLANPMKGTATLSDAQVADLRSGRWYFNIHTAAHPGGEIRGQVRPSH